MTKNNSFTVIELLVVIAVIGLLSSVILVSMGGIRTKARIVKGLEFSQGIQNALWNDAVGVWNFDEGSGATALDASGNGNSGTLHSGGSVCSNPPTAGCPTWTDDTPQKAGGGRSAGKYALSFDGADDYVDAGNAASLDIDVSPVTLAAWIKTNTISGQAEIIGRGLRGTHGYGINRNGNKINIGYHGGSNFDSNTAIDTGVWYYVVGMINDVNTRIYINGILDSASGAVNVTASTEKVYIGRESGGTTPFFSGTIDEVRIYGQVLTTSEIQKLYAEGLERHQLAEK